VRIVIYYVLSYGGMCYINYLPTAIFGMEFTSNETKASEPISNDYDNSGNGLEQWQAVLREKVACIQNQRKKGESSWWPGSKLNKIESRLTEAVTDLCGSLIAFADPDQSPEGFASTFANVQATKNTLCNTEGYGDLVVGERRGLNNAEEAIKFGAMAHLCASDHGLGAPIYHNPKTVALAESHFDVGSQIPGVSHLIVSEPKSRAHPPVVEGSRNR
jgi:hypothetical protein